MGIGENMLRKAEQHVDIVKTFPWLEGSRQSEALAVRERLEETPVEEREAVAGVIGCARVMDPDLAVELIENINGMKESERREIYRLSESDDSRERSLALTKAAKKPPTPDPRLGLLDAAIDSLRKASKPFPNDPLTPQIAGVIETIQKIRAAIKQERLVAVQ